MTQGTPRMYVCRARNNDRSTDNVRSNVWMTGQKGKKKDTIRPKTCKISSSCKFSLCHPSSRHRKLGVRSE